MITDSGLAEPDLKNLSSWLKDKFSSHGVAIVLVSPDDVKYHFHGFSNLGTKEKVNSKTRFEIGSVSKPLTAFLFVQAVLNKELGLETQLPSNLISSMDTLHSTSLLELITHKSGLPRLPVNMTRDDVTNPYAYYSKRHLKQGLSATTLGKKDFEYSNFAYGILSILAEEHFQRSYSDLMKLKVFTQLGMRTAGVNITDTKQKNLASGHDISGTEVQGLLAIIRQTVAFLICSRHQ